MLDTSDSHPSPTGPLLFDSLQENVVFKEKEKKL